MGFKDDFVWGVATAAYQIEGANHADGKGLSVWDTFCADGRAYEGHTGETACDHYHRSSEDIGLMCDVGIDAYRFSISWPRVLPDGTGAVNQKGLGFYDRLVDELLDKNITPYATLYHWDYPHELFKRGGWLNGDSPKWFADYVAVVGERLADRVQHFMTFNEPQCFIGVAFTEGIHAPGIKMPLRENLQMAHNVLLAHGLAVSTLRSIRRDLQIGIAPTGQWNYPQTGIPEDIEAARISNVGVHLYRPWYSNPTWWSDPIFFGEYPSDGLELFREALPDLGPTDMETINQPLDFYGQNIYNGRAVKATSDGGFERLERSPGFPASSLDWPLTPEAIYWGCKFIYERYQTPIYITEVGMACHDIVSVDGKVHDPNRIDMLHRYLQQLKRASEDGIDVSGVFVWSLIDNFEWAQGYKARFGLVYTDYETQRRVPKDSAYWYRDTIAANGDNLS